MNSCQVAIIGSGFAGTILARILNRQGLAVTLIERHEHPRFAIGESSTPLAAICLERLAETYDLHDLADLAAYGRWLDSIPEVRRGLKRGFTFYHHEPGRELENRSDNANRLLVAASPDDVVADSHWLRADVDHHLVRRAVDEGVDFRDRTEIREARSHDRDGWWLSGESHDAPYELTAEIVIDASGAAGFLAQTLPIDEALDEIELDTALVFGHFSDLGLFPEFDPGPYPDQVAAVHHLLEEGWMYVLPFDHGVVSAGILVRRQAMKELEKAGARDPEEVWERVIARYPTLARQFAIARAVRPLELMPRVQRRLRAAAGRGWALLPHTYTFLDPMYSTGIAWSLLAVERLASILTAGEVRALPPAEILEAGLERYGEQLAVEARHLTTLMEGTYLAMRDFELFVAQSLLYFVTVSFAEVEQRLFQREWEAGAAAWRGFLGAGDPHLESIFAESRRRLAVLCDGGVPARSLPKEDFTAWLQDVVAARNIAGLGDPERRNLYPVDLEVLVDRADLLGLTPPEMRRLLPRLRGQIEGR